MADQHWVDSDSCTPLTCNINHESHVISSDSEFDGLAYAAVTCNICYFLSETRWLDPQSAVSQPSHIATRFVLTSREPSLTRFS